MITVKTKETSAAEASKVSSRDSVVRLEIVLIDGAKEKRESPLANCENWFN